MRPACNWLRGIFFGLAFLSSGIAAAQSEALTLKRAVDLAVVHSPAAMEALADQQHAFQAYRETRDQIIPQMVLGAAIGDSWGYPLTLAGSAPSLFNLTAQSTLFSPALRSGVRAARTDYDASKLSAKDRRNQIIQDTTLDYLELLKWQQLMDALQKQHEDAANMEQVVQQRIQQGIDSAEQKIEARLAAARANLRLAQGQGAIDELRNELSHLTGLPAASIEAVADSVPALPEMAADPAVSEQAVESNAAVAFAQQRANAQMFKARAEHLALLPEVDFATQYAVLAKFNNWAQFFPSGAFQRNNASLGVVIRFPFFNASQHASAQAADADALRARKEAEATKNQVSQETLRLQHSVQQLGDAKEVAELEYEIAKSDLNAVQIRMNSGNATVHDAANARAQEAAKYDALQDADFQLLRARIGLMRVTGDLESWVEQKK